MSLKNPNCAGLLASDILQDCDDQPRSGIEQKLVLVNVDDADSSAITYDATNPNSLMDGFACKSGSTGYMIEGIKNNIVPSSELENPEDKRSGYRQSIQFRVLDPSHEVRDEINKMTPGSLFHAILERKWKGTADGDAFLVYGVKYGLEITAVSEALNENNGTIIVTLSTPAEVLEPYLPHVLLDSDYTTTKTAFNNKFATA